MPGVRHRGDEPALVTIAVDANGADLGPAEVAAGAAQAVDASDGLRVKIFGPAEALGVPGPRVEIVDAPVSIAKEAEPAAAVRANPEASIVQAWKSVAAGEADALVSGGSTGAALAAGLFEVKRAKGIYRPALAIPLPVPGRTVTLLDVGANLEVRTEHLVQFAYMGAAFVSAVLGVEHPQVGLLNVGEEETKGTQQLMDVHEQLRTSRSDSFEFVGNVEGRHFAFGELDIIVTDGFTGNVALKFAEAVSEATIDLVDAVTARDLRSRLGGRLIDRALRQAEDDIAPENAGGAYMLGLRKLGVVPHGRFTRHGISTAIQLAAKSVEQDVVGRTHAALESGGALRRGGASALLGG